MANLKLLKAQYNLVVKHGGLEPRAIEPIERYVIALEKALDISDKEVQELSELLLKKRMGEMGE